MASNTQDLNHSASKLPKIPKLQTAVPKLPTLLKASSSANPKAKPVIPALATSSAQAPVSNPLNDLDEGEETQAIEAPSAADIESAIAAMRGESAPEPATPEPAPEPAAPAPIPEPVPLPKIAPVLKLSAPKPIAPPMASSPSNKLPNLKPLSLKGGVGGPASPALAPKPAPAPVISESEDSGEETQAIDAPDFSSFEMPKAGGPIPVSPISAPAPSSPAVPSLASAPVAPSMPAAPKPSAPVPAASAIPPTELAGSPAVAPAYPSVAPSVPAAPAYPPAASSASEAESDGPIFGGAAVEDSSLQFEDESPDDAGEKTLMLDSAPDEELDIGGEKTQIQLSSMDYDPLSGKLIVESGKTNQREYILVREKTSIGRAPDNDITISDISMSRKHVEIDKFTEGFRIRDLNSGNGTVLNGYRIRVGQLRNGDIIEIGSIRFRFEQSGGDPEELWKGEPKIEYHSSQRVGNRNPGASPSTSMPPAPSYAATEAASFNAPLPSQAPASPVISAPQMESMLERQGGGIAAPTWASAPSLTSPYMMSYGPNALKKTTVTPIWAHIVLIVLFITCMGSIIYWCVLEYASSTRENEIKEQTELADKIKQEITKGVNEYSSLKFSNALININLAAEMDKDGIVVKDKSLFEFYRKLLTQEEEYSKEIKQIRNRTSNTIEEFEESLKYLETIPDSSLNKELAVTTHVRLLDSYHRRLKNDIRQYITDNDISKARELIRKLSALPDSADEVKKLNKLIADKSSQN